MYSLLFTLALCGQVEIGVPPAPAAEVPAAPAGDQAEEMRTWLLARLVIDSDFDEKKSAEAKRLLATMNEQQLTALVAAYKERTIRPVEATPLPSQPTNSAEQRALDQAKLDLQQAQAYRDHLKREYDRRILEGHMLQNLAYHNIVASQMQMYRSFPYTYGAISVGPFGYGELGYGGLGYGGLGYGVLNYGGWGYGAPAFGGFAYRAW